MAAPLDDVSVVTIESWMAAPSASAILADLGADVIKVEPLNGDPMRGLEPSREGRGSLQGLRPAVRRRQPRQTLDRSRARYRRRRRAGAPPDRRRRHLHVQPADTPAGAFRPRPGEPVADQSEARACDAHRLRHHRTRSEATGLRRHGILRPFWPLRLEPRRRRRRRADGASRTGRSHDRPRAGRRHSRGVADGGTHR